MGLFCWFISIGLWAWSLITHHHVHSRISLGFQILGLLGMGYLTWTRYQDLNTPYK
jgi:hypothetical protein